MRTAHTTAETHDGREVMLHGVATSIELQRAELRKVRGLRAHPEFAVIRYQESDGVEEIFHFSPEKVVAEPVVAKRRK